MAIKDIQIDVSPIKRASSEFQIEHWFDSLFDRLNLTYLPQQRILKGRPDCLIGNIIIDFKYNITDRQLNQWVTSKGRQYIQEYFDTYGNYPSLLIVISEKNIFYYDKDLALKNKRDIDKKSILSLIECLLKPDSINSEEFATLFGVNSPLYILSYARLETHFNDHSGEKTVCFQQWKKNFRLAYHDDDVGKELFLRHTYLSLLLKLILYKEFMNPEEYTREYFKDLENHFELLGISLFHYDFFRWVINVQGLCDDFFEKLKLMEFEATDIFRTIYQEMIIAGVRHRLGEYYTPEILCRKMVNKEYKVGDRVLDSSCGSGTFLIEMCKKIDSNFNLNTNDIPPEEWFDAINNIFGFDINPIAVLTTKANLILYFKSKKKWIEKININVYLCNSIDPIEFSPTADLELGSFYTYCIDLLDEELELRIPSELLSKTNIELFQKVIKSLYNVWEEFQEFEDTWEAALSNLENGLKSTISEMKEEKIIAIKKFFNIIYELRTEDKDHIWLYLLNNLVGIRLLLLKKKMDLIITNPPWLTYKDADSKLQGNMKKITQQFLIRPDAHNITNIEEAVVFLYKIPDLYLRNDGKGKIAFVMPKSLLVSSQNQKARRFDNFNNIEFFIFNDMIFNIECCCIFANYNTLTVDNKELFSKYPIKTYLLDSETMKNIETLHLEPYVYFQPKKKAKYLVKKLIGKEKKESLLPCHLSDYYEKFIQGADLIPKSLLYCNIIDTTQNGKISVIEPWISPQAKGVWKKSHYKRTRVESKNIYKATLSRQLYPFYIKPYDIFLPLDQELKYRPSNIGPFSRKHWNSLQNIYQREINKDLFTVGINYRNKLCTNNKVRDSQLKQYKVVFPNAKKLMAAVINDPKGRIYVDSTLYYYGTKSEDEAYYLCGMLNIPDLYTSVKVISDTRHHHKRPLYFNIPIFENNDIQLQISSISKKCANVMENYISKAEKIKENDINDLLSDQLNRIREIGLSILTSVDGNQIIKEYLIE